MPEFSWSPALFAVQFQLTGDNDGNGNFDHVNTVINANSQLCYHDLFPRS